MPDLTPPAIDERLDAIGRRRFFWRGQRLHLLLLVAMASAAWALGQDGEGAWGGLSSRTWFLLCLGLPVLHQVLVALSWRAQLVSGLYTRLFGRRDLVAWAVVFLPLLFVRPLVVLGLGLADAGSLQLPAPWALGLGAVLAVPSLYTLYSVRRYFGIDRALGGDHFRDSYRHLPMVTGGAFAWTSNAMYTLAFLGLWSIALLTRSELALVAALFQHAYIQVHWLCTEKPDMDLLYGS